MKEWEIYTIVGSCAVFVILVTAVFVFRKKSSDSVLVTSVKTEDTGRDDEKGIEILKSRDYHLDDSIGTTSDTSYAFTNDDVDGSIENFKSRDYHLDDSIGTTYDTSSAFPNDDVDDAIRSAELYLQNHS
jgi:hypothetical protein